MAKEIMVTSSIFFLALFGMPRNAHCCLQCEKEFTNKFNYYRKHLWWRSAWAGDLIYCQKFIDAWVKEIKETKVALREYQTCFSLFFIFMLAHFGILTP